MRARDHELVCVLPQAAEPLDVSWVVRTRLVDERTKPQQHESDGHGRSEVCTPLAIGENDKRHGKLIEYAETTTVAGHWRDRTYAISGN